MIYSIYSLRREASTMISIGDVHKLVGELESSARNGAGMTLTPACLEVLLHALRDVDSPPFQVDAVEVDGGPWEILAISRDAALARAIYDAAAAQKSGGRIRLTRGARILSEA